MGYIKTPLQVPYHLDKICCFNFDDLCGRPVGTPDYIALTNHYHTVFLHDIPSLASFEDSPNEIRRFIQLIDILYEKQLRVIFDSRVPLLKLFGTTSISRVSNTDQ